MQRRVKLAIVGRPNVGKSTLFNRLAGRPMAIVHDRPGVTRDRREAFGSLGDLRLELIDTAGLEVADPESLEGRMRAQTEKALADADVILFIIDARTGVMPVDETFADLVRRTGRPVLLIANKCEGKAGDGGLADAYALGLGEPIPLSAAHGDGLGELYSALEPHAVQRETLEAEDDDKPPIRLAIVGRPNAGKSTLINALIEDDRLLTGPEAGITRDAIAVRWRWKDREIRLHDTAGLRKRAKVEDSLERMSTSDTIRAINFAEIVLVVMDEENAFEKQDLQIADLVVREGRGLILIITKWDQVKDKPSRRAALMEKAKRLLPQAPDAPILTVSSISGQGLDRLMPTVLKLREDWSAKIKTRDLNDWLHEAISRHPPPAVNGRRIKPRYIAQMKARPPTFVLMCSRAAKLPDSYQRYLVNSLREAFEMPAVPIRFVVRAPKNPYVKK
jgi:GTPase